jgi:hypothetical protein
MGIGSREGIRHVVLWVPLLRLSPPSLTHWQVLELPPHDDKFFLKHHAIQSTHYLILHLAETLTLDNHFDSI